MTKMADRRDRASDYEEHLNKYHDIREERRIAKKKAKIRRIVAAFVVVVIVMTGFVTKDYWMPQVAEFFEDKTETIINDGTPETGGGFPINLSQSGYNYITSVEDMATVISDTHITMYNSKGGVHKKIQHMFAKPVYYTMDKKLFVYDLDGYRFSVYDKKGEVYSVKTDDAIVVAAASRDGKAAVVTQTDKFSSYLTIYDESGEAIFKWSGGQKIVNVSFNDSSDGCIISTFSASGGKIVSRLYGLQFDKTTETFKTSDLEGLVYKSGYCENGDMWLLGDSVLYRVASDGSVIYTYEYDRELSSFELSKKMAVLVFDSVTGDNQEIRIFGKSKEPAVYKTDSKVKKLQIIDGNAVFMTNRSFAFLDTDAKIKASAELEKVYSDFAVMKDEVYFVGYNEVDKIEFKR